MNIRAAQKMMETQVLDYLFPFSGFQFETDVNFIVMTIGKQSTFFKACPKHLEHSAGLNTDSFRRISTFRLTPRLLRLRMKRRGDVCTDR